MLFDQMFYQTNQLFQACAAGAELSFIAACDKLKVKTINKTIKQGCTNSKNGLIYLHQISCRLNIYPQNTSKANNTVFPVVNTIFQSLQNKSK